MATLLQYLKPVKFLPIRRCRNSNERGWLDYFIRETKQKLEGK